MIETTDPRYVAAELEAMIVAHFRPYFLSMVMFPDEEPPRHQLMIVSHKFNGMSIADRVAYVFNLINSTNGDILNHNAIIIEAFTASEFEDLIEYTEI
jgi:stress-induced morphogen